MRRGLAGAMVALALAGSGCAARRPVVPAPTTPPALEVIFSAGEAPQPAAPVARHAASAQPRPVPREQRRRPARRQVGDAIPTTPSPALAPAAIAGDEGTAPKPGAGAEPADQPQSAAGPHDTRATAEGRGEYDARWGRPRPCEDCPGGH